MDETQRTRLSKLMALVLRHRAGDFGLRLDAEGFVPADELVAALRRQRGWASLTVADLEEVIATQQKRRYEIVDGDIRAIYGHSLDAEVSYPQVQPPALLLHGTARRFVAAIAAQGLRPMNRQYVHMTDDPALAALTGRRRDPEPAILRIRAAAAHADGLVFYQADSGVFLARAVPPQYIEPPAG